MPGNLWFWSVRHAEMCLTQVITEERNRNPSAARKVQNLMRKTKIWASTRKRSTSH